MKKTIIIALFTFFLCHKLCYSQTEESLALNKHIPFFILDDVEHYSKKQITSNDFNGKWWILDFWTEYCGGCINSMPNNNALQQQFGDKLQFILIGYNGSGYYKNSRITSLYEVLRKKYDLKFPVAYDSVLMEKFKIESVPCVVIIDPNGIVKKITYGPINAEIINDVLSSNLRVDESTHFSYDKKIPFLTNNNGGPDTGFLYRSLLSRWNHSMEGITLMQIYYQSLKGKFEVLGVPLDMLYRYAYKGEGSLNGPDSLYGSFYPNPVLELKDSSLFQYDWATRKSLYCYSLIVPEKKASKNYLMSIMQSDLKNYFGYDVKIEIRKMPYWRLVANEYAKNHLRTKSDSSYTKTFAFTQLVLRNQPVKELTRILSLNFQGYPPFIDQTGIKENIDITINALLIDIDEVKEALHNQGLDLIKGEKEMKVIVIRDPEN